VSEEPASFSTSKMEVCVVCRDRRVQIQIGRDVGMGWTFQDTCDFYINGLWIQYTLLHVTTNILRTCICIGKTPQENHFIYMNKEISCIFRMCCVVDFLQNAI